MKPCLLTAPDLIGSYPLSSLKKHFDKINGIVIGYNYDLQKDGNIYPQMEDILLEYTKEYSFPIIKCNDFGHKIVNSIIPIGVNAKIENSKVIITDEFLK